MKDRHRHLLEAPNFCHLVTRRSDRDVRVVVVWVDTDGTHVVLNGSEGKRQWLDDVRRDPRVICTVVNIDDPYEYLTIHGEVVDERHEGANAHICELHLKYKGNRSYPLRDGEQRVIVKVAPTRLRHWGAAR